MTRKLFLIPLLILALALSACGTDAPAPASPSNGADTTSEQAAPAVIVPSSEQYASPSLDTTYEGALPVRLQLTLGTLMLDGTPEAITPEQAQTLLPLWQALQALTASGTSATAETNAVLAQIESSLTAEQLNAIRAMQLTSPKMQEWATENGISLGSGGGAGTGAGQGGGMSPEARATRQAEEGKTPSETGASNGASAALTKTVIEYLASVQP
ncbi:MAG TPA: hypothetical protein DCG54_00550 [Anaerolineae bacterium]|nr:hypothetical protein [Anaerolineae bacterium]